MAHKKGVLKGSEWSTMPTKKSTATEKLSKMRAKADIGFHFKNVIDDFDHSGFSGMVWSEA